MSSGEPVVKPVVSVYPAASSAHLQGRSSLLCVASSMFPPLVRFSWRRREENGSLQEKLPDDAEQLEFTESGRTASILLLHQQETSRYRYRCYVHHEGGKVEAPSEQGDQRSSSSSSRGDAAVKTAEEQRRLLLMLLTHNQSLLFCFRGQSSSISSSVSFSVSSSGSSSVGSSVSSGPVSVPGEAAVPAVRRADSEEPGVLLWSLSGDGPQEHGSHVGLLSSSPPISLSL